MSDKIIDSLIQIAKEQESNAYGSNKKCFLIDEYALLKQDFTIEEVEKMMQLTEELEKKGVNVARTLDYKVLKQNIRMWNTDKDVTISSGYVLQQRAKGTPLLDGTNWNEENKRYQIEYLKQIDSISKENQAFFDDFVNGWIELQESGIRLDPSKTGNFIYEQGKGITFIDLGLTDERTDMSYQVYEQIAVIMNLNAYYKCYPEVQQAVDKRLSIITEKYRNATLERGIDSSLVDKMIKSKVPISKEKFDNNLEENIDEITKLEQIIDEHIKEERRRQSEEEEKARLVKERRAEEISRLEAEEEKQNGAKRNDSKMYALLNELIEQGKMPEEFNNLIKRKTNIYKDLSLELFKKQGTLVNLKSILPSLENNYVEIDMRNMRLKSDNEISYNDYQLMMSEVKDYFKEYFEKIANNSDFKLSKYNEMKNMKKEGTLKKEQYIDFRLLESELNEFSNAQDVFSYLGIQDEKVYEQSEKVSEFLKKQNEISEEDRINQDKYRSENDREFLDFAFKKTGVTDKEELRRMYEEQDDLRVSDEDLEFILESFEESKTINPSQIRKSTVKEKIGLIDINNIIQEIRKELEVQKENSREDERSL